MRFFHYLIAMTATATLCPAAAGEAIVCPAELPAEAVQIRNVPAGWQPYTTSPIYLHSGAPMFGPPDQLGRLIGKTTQGRNGEFSVDYDDLDHAPDVGLWFACDYGMGNEFSIAKRLPPSTKSCRVKYQKGEKFGQNRLDITCR